MIDIKGLAKVRLLVDVKGLAKVRLLIDIKGLVKVRFSCKQNNPSDGYPSKY